MNYTTRAHALASPRCQDILACLRRESHLVAAEIARRVGCSPSQALHALNVLYAARLVERKPVSKWASRRYTWSVASGPKSIGSPGAPGAP